MNLYLMWTLLDANNEILNSQLDTYIHLLNMIGHKMMAKLTCLMYCYNVWNFFLFFLEPEMKKCVRMRTALNAQLLSPKMSCKK